MIPCQSLGQDLDERTVAGQEDSESTGVQFSVVDHVKTGECFACSWYAGNEADDFVVVLTRRLNGPHDGLTGSSEILRASMTARDLADVLALVQDSRGLKNGRCRAVRSSNPTVRIDSASIWRSVPFGYQFEHRTKRTSVSLHQWGH
jgi:hypothetical protein